MNINWCEDETNRHTNLKSSQITRALILNRCQSKIMRLWQLLLIIANQREKKKKHGHWKHEYKIKWLKSTTERWWSKMCMTRILMFTAYSSSPSFFCVIIELRHTECSVRKERSGKKNGKEKWMGPKKKRIYYWYNGIFAFIHDFFFELN